MTSFSIIIYNLSYSAIARSEYMKNVGFPKPVNVRKLAMARNPQKQPSGVPKGNYQKPQQSQSQQSQQSQQLQQSPQDSSQEKPPGRPLSGPSIRGGGGKYTAAGRIKYRPFKPQTVPTHSVITDRTAVHLKHAGDRFESILFLKVKLI